LVIVGEEKEVFEVFGLGPVSHCGPTKFWFFFSFKLIFLVFLDRFDHADVKNEF
jgi:hypothetical protein